MVMYGKKVWAENIVMACFKRISLELMLGKDVALQDVHPE
jgi:hypothetical protein